jgi:hypothetical protein
LWLFSGRLGSFGRANQGGRRRVALNRHPGIPKGDLRSMELLAVASE